jgi:hypothetical protein
MTNFIVVKIYEPEGDQFTWAILDREGKVVATYGSRALARQRCKMYKELYPEGVVRFESVPS